MLSVKIIEVTCSKCKVHQTFTFRDGELVGGLVGSSHGEKLPVFVRRGSAMVHVAEFKCKFDGPALLYLVGKARICKCGALVKGKRISCQDCGLPVFSKSVGDAVGSLRGKRHGSSAGCTQDTVWEPDEDVDPEITKRYKRERSLWQDVPDTAAHWQQQRGSVRIG